MKQEVEKTALIVGLGASGLACAHHLGRRGWKIRAADTREAPAGAQRLGAEMPDAEIRTGGLPESLLDGVSLVVMSPRTFHPLRCGCTACRERQGPRH